MLTKVNVTARVSDQNGAAVAGAIVTARLTHTDVDSTYGYVVPKLLSTVANDSGEATLALWPNELGVTASQYEFTLTDSRTRRTERLTATVPNADCLLSQIANLPPYPGKSDGQLALDAALAARDEALEALAACQDVLAQIQALQEGMPTPGNQFGVANFSSAFGSSLFSAIQ